mmetsp:Transcript_8534/g.35145  ORF Transcript_8534/g.35145 Transcript_8534/m.35145 type:complete len:183 (-) Transcript_8534:678-1226(-)
MATRPKDVKLGKEATRHAIPGFSGDARFYSLWEARVASQLRPLGLVWLFDIQQTTFHAQDPALRGVTVETEDDEGEMQHVAIDEAHFNRIQAEYAEYLMRALPDVDQCTRAITLMGSSPNFTELWRNLKVIYKGEGDVRAGAAQTRLDQLRCTQLKDLEKFVTDTVECIDDIRFAGVAYTDA